MLHPYTNQLMSERRGGVVNTPASYSGGPRLKSQPRDRLTDVSHDFPQSLQTDAEIVP
jgi:hypothetical protein